VALFQTPLSPKKEKERAMNSGVTVTVSLDFKPELADSFFNETLPELQKQTIAFEGVREVRAVRQAADPAKILFIDIFETQQAADKYFSWRGDRGDLKWLATLLAAPPKIEIWPFAIEGGAA